MERKPKHNREKRNDVGRFIKGNQSRSGTTHTDRSKQKISQNHPDFSGSNNPMFGKKHSEQTKIKIKQNHPSKNNQYANPMSGRFHNRETKERMKMVREEYLKTNPIPKGKLSPHYGKLHSLETKEIISQKLKGRVVSEFTKQKHRDIRLKQKIPTKFTSIELKIKELLDQLHIPYQTHKAVMGITQPDFFIEPNTCIYCDGDYWHNLPNCIERDKKINEILKFGGYKVIRLWEHEIKVMELNDLKEIMNATSR